MVATMARHRDRREWTVFAVGWATAAILAVAAAGALARADAERALDRQASTTAALHAAVLRSELQRQRAIPSVLADDSDLRALLSSPTPAAVARLNEKLERLAQDARAAALYVIDADGTTLAASNWREATSFVGSNYRFRPYFIDAMARGEAAFFALGTVSGRPGLYLAERIDAGGRALGVVVIKVEFDALEAEWRASEEPTYVTDAEGVVLITTAPEWRFRATRPLSEARRRQLAASTTAGPTLIDLPFDSSSQGLLRIQGADGGDFAHAIERTPGLGWTLHLLAPANATLTRAVGAARVVALLSVALLAGLTGVLLRRRQRARLRADEEEAARQDLERQIQSRTAELRAANDRLTEGMEERRKLEETRQALQDDLIQATKLATLGQIAAGVAHEINQPVAAIRTLADSAAVYLDRADPAGAARALDRIGALTTRVGAITDELRAFSRKTRSKLVAVSVDEAIDGALMLIGPRLRERGVRLRRQRGSSAVRVLAEGVRLEQVVLNLLQNAVEAVKDRADPAISVTVSVEEEVGRVTVAIADNGAGVSPHVRNRLFTPFTTDKVNGMGLGLVISRDIIAGFGGDLYLAPTRRGAAFHVVLKVAP